MLITAAEILMGRDKANPLTSELKENLESLLVALNKFRLAYGKPMTVSSGYRPPATNASTKGAAKHSWHMVCFACDFKDLDGSLDAWCLAHLDVLKDAGLWLESPDSTPGWCHLQAVPPHSGSRVFKP